MSAKNTSFSLGEHFDRFIASKIEEGRYTNASEVLRASLRMKEDYDMKMQALRSAIAEGEASGRGRASGRGKGYNAAEIFAMAKICLGQ